MRRMLTAVVIGLVLGSVVAPAAALAHGGLVTTSPPQGASVPSPMDAVSLTFTEKPQPFAFFAITGPDGVRVDNGWSNGEPVPLATPAREFQQVNGAWQPMEYRTGFPVRIKVAHWPATGTYVVRYQNVASDGDQVKGEMSFSYTGAATAAPAGWQPPTDQPKAELAGGTVAAAPAPVSTKRDRSVWIWLVPVLLVVAAILSFLVTRSPAGWVRRRDTAQESPASKQL